MKLAGQANSAGSSQYFLKCKFVKDSAMTCGDTTEGVWKEFTQTCLGTIKPNKCLSTSKTYNVNAWDI